MCDVQVAVMILSLGFIAFVTLLHIVGKVKFVCAHAVCVDAADNRVCCILYPDMHCVLQLRGK